MKKTLSICGIIALLSGCSDNINGVKNGTMEFNKTLTIGQAFDNWNECNPGYWEEFKTDNGVEVVQFTCHVNNASEYAKRVGELVSEETEEALDINDSKIVFQWTINKDSTFQVQHAGLEVKWNDGKTYETNIDVLTYLQSIYNNEVAWDMNNLSEENKGFAENEYYNFLRLRSVAN